MNVLVSYILAWVVFASVMLGVGSQIFGHVHPGLWFLRIDGTWPELGQVGGRAGAAWARGSRALRCVRTLACLAACLCRGGATAAKLWLCSRSSGAPSSGCAIT